MGRAFVFWRACFRFHLQLLDAAFQLGDALLQQADIALQGEHYAVQLIVIVLQMGQRRFQLHQPLFDGNFRSHRGEFFDALHAAVAALLSSMISALGDASRLMSCMLGSGLASLDLSLHAHDEPTG